MNGINFRHVVIYGRRGGLSGADFCDLLDLGRVPVAFDFALSSLTEEDSAESFDGFSPVAIAEITDDVECDVSGGSGWMKVDPLLLSAREVLRNVVSRLVHEFGPQEPPPAIRVVWDVRRA